MAFDFKKEYKELYRAKSKAEIVDVPAINYIAVSGKGNPNDVNGDYQKAVAILYAVAYTIKNSHKTDHKIEGFIEHIVPPLEGFWWQDNVVGIDLSNKDSYNWIAVIRLPDFVSQKDFDWAVETASKKKKIDCSLARFITIAEGLCVQIKHVGSYDNEAESIAKMEKLLKDKGYETDFNGIRFHHEIYLSNPKRVAEEKRRTIIRHPIKKTN